MVSLQTIQKWIFNKFQNYENIFLNRIDKYLPNFREEEFSRPYSHWKGSQDDEMTWDHET